MSLKRLQEIWRGQQFENERERGFVTVTRLGRFEALRAYKDFEEREVDEILDFEIVFFSHQFLQFTIFALSFIIYYFFCILVFQKISSFLFIFFFR